jgi:hypothetical protein
MVNIFGDYFILSILVFSLKSSRINNVLYFLVQGMLASLTDVCNSVTTNLQRFHTFEVSAYAYN